MLAEQQLVVDQESDAWYVHASLVNHRLFTVLYDRHAPALYRYARGRVGADAVDDMVSETFLVAFRRRHRYDTSRVDARPWLFGILTKEISHYRRRERAHYRAMARCDPGEVAPDPAERAVAGAAAHALRAPLARALSDLAARDRDVLLLIAWGGLSYEETAQAIGIPVGTVRSRLNRARRKVSSALGGNDPTRAVEETM
ncbi:RNA polymerase sigma factor [Micromonospora saelicesensis]|uniref:RNA polymerase sigma-70 factor, ECF subfamily n=1 Tax=Micromonospora saelicesensis TaxID=285676 RepID=A0A1C4WRM3_9ACTN|nr:RNA polymerase sigma factor [Micromonospora saelicesensis]RAN99428.1 RNA polymerase sigma-E factor [Micromonospora saelicesensis]RAO46079.1 RNA polymerase sigma-E factor [Micromonospora saelicesensis]RAO51851.1 RNA polymerase sigma-E factor [Micromonospora saelicesensis]RAO56802.1 RNA polymerase sigma-E factor [Micromonospora saelicesensis]SCE98824.1 RNA polymerase sigma-70 factor, ECF subfamily [Micromonospora saelicesensis]